MELERERVFYPSAEGPELEVGELADWNERGHWDIYKDGVLVRHYPEWEEEGSSGKKVEYSGATVCELK